MRHPEDKNLLIDIIGFGLLTLTSAYIGASVGAHFYGNHESLLLTPQEFGNTVLTPWSEIGKNAAGSGMLTGLMFSTTFTGLRLARRSGLIR